MIQADIVPEISPKLSANKAPMKFLPSVIIYIAYKLSKITITLLMLSMFSFIFNSSNYSIPYVIVLYSHNLKKDKIKTLIIECFIIEDYISMIS